MSRFGTCEYWHSSHKGPGGRYATATCCVDWGDGPMHICARCLANERQIGAVTKSSRRLPIHSPECDRAIDPADATPSGPDTGAGE